MHSWVFRNRRRLEAIYDAPGRSPADRRPRRSAQVAERRDARAAAGAEPALAVVELTPRARRRVA